LRFDNREKKNYGSIVAKTGFDKYWLLFGINKVCGIHIELALDGRHP
jgi:hypothetical protein